MQQNTHPENPSIILASSSPRRQQFFHELGIPFRVIVADIDESPLSNESPVDLVRRLAQAKALAVAAHIQDTTPHVMVAADTTVALGSTILGKPTDAADAVAMLTLLRDRAHEVHSAVSVVQTLADGQVVMQKTVVNSTEVVMRAYTDDEMAVYVASGDPLDKAGAYAIQNSAFAPVASINGCVASVVGLPLGTLRDLLRDCGIELSAKVAPVCERQANFPCCQRPPIA